MALDDELSSPHSDRTPTAHGRSVREGVRCFERSFEGHESKPPVKLVVFDCDETLTLSTFMPREKALREEIGWIEFADYISMVNFESPFLDGSRIERLKECFEKLQTGNDGQRRILTVLSRNENGAIACLNLLMMAKLDVFFSAIWGMRANKEVCNACYRNGDDWIGFESRFDKCFDHKADVLVDVIKNPFQWFPQLTPDGLSTNGEDMRACLELRMENIVLVDDVRTNFQSSSPEAPMLYRYCKVSRYDSELRQMGYITNMGGLGARSTDDYTQLENFVAKPWQFKAAHGVRCFERPFSDASSRPPVKLVVFDFDETLSLYTFMPTGHNYRTQIGYMGMSQQERAHYVKYNFESPYTDGDRVAKLQSLLERLEDRRGVPRTLAILTNNKDGAIAVLNLLVMADLEKYFSVIWTLGSDFGLAGGVYKDVDKWKSFSLPTLDTEQSKNKPLVLDAVIAKPEDWFPQMIESSDSKLDAKWAALQYVKMENIVLVDDERGSFQLANENDSDEDRPTARVLRYCKVAHYDDVYRDQGLLVHMGGIGAKADRDFKKLAYFVEAPWKSPVADPTTDMEYMLGQRRGSFYVSERQDEPEMEQVELIRRKTEDWSVSAKSERKQRKNSLAPPVFSLNGQSHSAEAATAEGAAASAPWFPFLRFVEAFCSCGHRDVRR